MAMIIGLHGEAGSGKDQFALYAEEWIYAATQGKFQKLSFAEPVYTLASVIFGVTVESLGERRKKEIPLWFNVTKEALERANDYWEAEGFAEYADFAYIWPIFEEKYFGSRRVNLAGQDEDVIYSIYISAREILQLLGTEFGRKMVSPSVWKDYLVRAVKKGKADFIIVTDVRFNDEAHIIHTIPGMSESIVLNIVSPTTPFAIKSGHASENGIDKQHIDRTFTNTFEGLEKMKHDVNFFMEEFTFMHI